MNKIVYTYASPMMFPVYRSGCYWSIDGQFIEYHFYNPVNQKSALVGKCQAQTTNEMKQRFEHECFIKIRQLLIDTYGATPITIGNG